MLDPTLHQLGQCPVFGTLLLYFTAIIFVSFFLCPVAPSESKIKVFDVFETLQALVTMRGCGFRNLVLGEPSYRSVILCTRVLTVPVNTCDHMGSGTGLVVFKGQIVTIGLIFSVVWAVNLNQLPAHQTFVLQ